VSVEPYPTDELKTSKVKITRRAARRSMCGSNHRLSWKLLGGSLLTWSPSGGRASNPLLSWRPRFLAVLTSACVLRILPWRRLSGGGNHEKNNGYWPSPYYGTRRRPSLTNIHPSSTPGIGVWWLAGYRFNGCDVVGNCSYCTVSGVPGKGGGRTPDRCEWGVHGKGQQTAGAGICQFAGLALYLAETQS
jgi:hypothetical protein